MCTWFGGSGIAGISGDRLGSSEAQPLEIWEAMMSPSPHNRNMASEEIVNTFSLLYDSCNSSHRIEDVFAGHMEVSESNLPHCWLNCMESSRGISVVRLFNSYASIPHLSSDLEQASLS